MENSVTHFEIYGEEPDKLADFYRNVFGWQIEQMPGVNYWRIQSGSAESKPLHGGLTYRAIPDLNGWMLFVNVISLDETVALVQTLGGSIVRPKTACPGPLGWRSWQIPRRTSLGFGRRIQAPFLRH